MNHTPSVATVAPHPRKDRELSGLSKTSSHSLFGGPHSIQVEKCKQQARLTCRTICRDYCNNTAVHGFRYFFEEGRSVQERAFWVCGVFLCFAISFFLVSKVWAKWETSPVIVTFADAPTPVWSVPFPAVTICPSTKTKQSLFNYTLAEHHILDNVSTEEEYWKYQALSLICVSQGGKANVNLNESAIDFLYEVAPSIDDVFVSCQWQHRSINCSQFFLPVLTDEGVCFTFNGLSSQEMFSNETFQAQRDPPSFPSSGWTVDGGYSDNEGTIKKFPRRQQFVGPDTGLRVLLQSFDADMDYVCKGCEQGFRVYLHSPAETAGSARHYTALSLNTSMYLLASPTLMTTTDGLKEYSPTRRSCYFPMERKLRFYKFYSMENCIYECLSNLTLQRCGCAPIGMPRLAGFPLCSIFSKCSVEVYEKILDDAEKVPFERGIIPEECQCLASCRTMTYRGEATTFDFPWNMERIARRKNASREGLSRSQLNVYFDSLQFVTSQRRELYGHIDFLANTGGLLGLFTGFSVISLVEIFYYVSLRLWCDIKRRAEERRRRNAS